MKEMMSAKEVIAKLNDKLKNYKDDINYCPLDDDWVRIAKWLGEYILEQDRKIQEYERVLKSRDNRIKEATERFEKKELDIPNIPEVLGDIDNRPPLFPGYNC